MNMTFPDRTLDLTGLNGWNFVGEIRIRQLADWASDYWKNGFKLSRVKLPDKQYHILLNEIRRDNMFMKAKEVNFNQVYTINLGFGEIEIVNEDVVKKRT